MQDDRHAFLRVTEREQQCFTVLVGVTIDDGGVVGFVGIFDECIPAFHLQLRPHISCAYPFGQVVHVGLLVKDGENSIHPLILADITTAEGEVGACVLHGLRPLVDAEFEVTSEGSVLRVVPAARAVGVAVPIAPLLAADDGGVDTFVRCKLYLPAA